MKLKSVERVIDDYSKVKSTSDNSYDGYELTNSLFRPLSEYAFDAAEIRLANNEGEVALHELSSFITNTAYPTDGSWVRFAPQDRTNIEQMQVSKEMCAEISRRLRYDTNFYEEIAESVADGILWKRGFVDTKYSDGIYFECFEGRGLCVSKSKGNMRRVYSEREVPLKELNYIYKNVPAEYHTDNVVDTEETVRVLTCFLPNSTQWFERKRGLVKFIEVNILLDSAIQLELHGSGDKGYSTCPIHIYQVNGHRSLAKMAVHPAVTANFYEKIALDRARLINFPTMYVDEENVRANNVNFGAGDIISGTTNSVRPEAVQSLTAGDPHNHEVIQMQVSRIERIFKTKEIQNLRLQGLSQYAYNSMKYQLMSAIFPLLSGLSSGFTSDLLGRVRALYIKHDKDFAAKYADIEGDFICNHIDEEMSRSKTLANIGMLGQAIAPWINLPGVVETLNGPAIVALSAFKHDLPEVLNSPDSVRRQLEEQAKIQQKSENLEDEKTMSEINLNKSKQEE